jgi:hypothetical protein
MRAVESGMASKVVRRQTTAVLTVPFVAPIVCVVATLAVDPEHWLVLATFYIGASLLGGLALSAIRVVRVRKELEASPALSADAVETKPRRSWALAVGVLFEAAVVLGVAWLWSIALDDPYSGGVVFAATVLTAMGMAQVAEARMRTASERPRRPAGSGGVSGGRTPP